MEFGRWTLLSLGVALAAAFAPARGDAALVRDTSLRPAPEAEARVAFLTPSTPIELLETRDGWVRVRIEGWVPAADVAGAPAKPAPPAAPAVSSATPVDPGAPAAPPPSAAAPPRSAPTTVSPAATTTTPAPATPPPVLTAPPAAPPLAAAGSATLEGTIKVQFNLLKKRVASGAPVLLLPGGVDLGLTLDAETAARLAQLETEAARLEGQAKQAMQQTSNFTEATQVRDRLMAERAGLLTERQDLLAFEHGRHEQAARAAALAHAIADSRGFFRITPVPPGEYVLYVRMTREDADLEWIEPLKLSAGPLRLDLDEKRARGMLPKAAD